MPATRFVPDTPRVRAAHRSVVVLATAILLGVVLALAYLTHEVYEGVTEGDGVAGLDHPALQTAVQIRSTPLTWLAVAATEAAGRVGTPLIAICAAVVLYVRRRSLEPALVLLPALAGPLAITVVGKNLTGRVRPPREFALPPFETSPSFPSGHTLNATVLAAVIAYLVVRGAHRTVTRILVCGAAVVFTVGVALSRVYLGQHWLTDVIAGFLIGLAWAVSLMAANELRSRLHRRRANAEPAVAEPSRPETGRGCEAQPLTGAEPFAKQRS